MLMPSAGTAEVLGLNKMKQKDPPTCAYIMVGKKCRGSCLFCAQRSEPGNVDENLKSDFLSRITWKAEDDGKVLDSIVEKFDEGSMKRVCFQAVRGEGVFDRTLASLKYLKKSCDIPVCVSINGISREQLRQLYEAGAERIAFSFDAATPALFEKIKGTSWQDEWKLYEETNRLFPGRTVIHLIAGLGETEEEMSQAIALFYLTGAEVSLFAFTPVPGTPLAKKKQPPLNSYRKLQAALYLIRKKGVPPVKEPETAELTDNEYLKFQKETDCVFHRLKDYLIFNNGKITFHPDKMDFLMNYIPSEAFQTYGCPDCNRPMYNERPGRVPFNYPRVLSKEELRNAVESLYQL